MIVEITPELVLEALRPGNQIHVKIEQGIGPDYSVEDVQMNDRGNIEILLRHKNDPAASTARYVVSMTSLDCEWQEFRRNHGE